MLDCDQSRLADEVAAMEAAGADRVQWDVMDGSFVPRLTHGPDPVRDARAASRLQFEAHLMVDHPETLWRGFVDAGCEVVIVHAEATRHLHGLLKDIRDAGARAGVALNPATPLDAVLPVIDSLDHLLVMTVNPGRGGQEFIGAMTAKVRAARALVEERGLDLDIEVDGGVNAGTAPLVAEAGANLLVAGSAVVRHPEGRAAAIDEIRLEAVRGWRRRRKLEAERGGEAPEEPGDPLRRGVELFNEGQFWEAHEAWEGAWMPHRRSAEGDFYKGLVQVAAGFYHYRRHNRGGALVKWRSGADFLRPHGPSHEGVLVEPLVTAVEEARARLEKAGPEWPAIPAPRLDLEA